MHDSEWNSTVCTSRQDLHSFALLLMHNFIQFARWDESTQFFLHLLHTKHSNPHTYTSRHLLRRTRLVVYYFPFSLARVPFCKDDSLQRKHTPSHTHRKTRMNIFVRRESRIISMCWLYRIDVIYNVPYFVFANCVRFLINHFALGGWVAATHICKTPIISSGFKTRRRNPSTNPKRMHNLSAPFKFALFTTPHPIFSISRQVSFHFNTLWNEFGVNI